MHVRFNSMLRLMAALGLAASVVGGGAAINVSASSDVYHPGESHKSPVKSAHAAKPGGGGGSNNLSYHGGTGGYAVESGADKVYIVQWGWAGVDPSGEGPRQQSFFSNVGGSTWNGSVTQYCQGTLATGATTCPTTGVTFASNPAGVYAGTWADDSNALPSTITQSTLAAEAVRAAAHFGNTLTGSNNTVQYVIDTPTGHSTSGFGTQFCAWHSSTTSSYGTIAYTNFPYQTDAGASCGQNFVNAGAAGLLDGVTIVGGHEFAETETDIFPSGGWLDANGKENGDKCAWISSGQGASTNVVMGAQSFAVQSLWSNSFNSGAGGCVTFYAGPANQH
ncbi:MAG: hypothetical protein NVSMB17_12180 [Candidatus Dormibacteria bacterium]